MAVSNSREKANGLPDNYLILNEDDYRILGSAEFGQDGLQAIEVLGPFVDVQASGPLITIHDSTVEAHKGIGHHLHRHNERLFYILSGELDHDDPRNDIQGHIGPGDVGLFTEGQGGMLHSEWNHGDVPTRAYILVYTTNPIPDQTSFTPLRDEQAPRYEEGEGVSTKELVGERSPLKVHGDLRLFTDSTLRAGQEISIVLGDGEGGLLSIRSGRIHFGEHQLEAGDTLLLPPADGARSLTFKADDEARVLRVVHGPGHGFIRRGGHSSSIR